jgi:hypothetical protein
LVAAGTRQSVLKEENLYYAYEGKVVFFDESRLQNAA